MRVQLSYGAFTQTMSIHIDGQPLSHVSRLTKYQSKPFEAWCGEICDAIAEEVNGRYELSYMGRSCEARILGQLARNTAACTSFASEAPPISGSAVVRLKRLSGLVQSGLVCPRMSREIRVYTDGLPDGIKSAISKTLPKLAFCRIRLSVDGLDALGNHPADAPAYILLFKPSNVPAVSAACQRTMRAAMIVVDDQTQPLCKNGDCFVEHVPEQNCLAVLDQYLELWSYASLLSDALKGISIGEDEPMYLQVMALDKQEPMTQVVFPASIEFDTISPIKIRTIPPGGKSEDIKYRISDESVIQLTPSGLKAVGVGEAVVEAYSAGKSVKVASQRITCYRRNRIQAISVEPTDMDMLVGDRAPISYSFSPADADDASKVRLVSSDGTVAVAETGMYIKARAPGNCAIRVQSERATASCNVRVYPRLKALQVNVDQIETSVGNVVHLDVLRNPSNATLQKLTYSVSPSDLGRYDHGAKGFYAQGQGTGELVISASDGSVETRIPIKVKKAKKSSGFLNWKTVLVSLVVIAVIAYFILKGA